jgi:pimeloyl-ACP methyl ester carboxylesterase
VFLMHGTPGSRLGPAPRASALYRLGVRLITYDRPGYGDSDRRPGRSVASAAEDVQAIADTLQLDRFAVVGRSGGAPHALACAALLPDRVRRTAALVSLAPRDATGLDWFEGMTAPNVRGFSNAELAREQVGKGLEFRARRIREDPGLALRELAEALSPTERAIIDDPDFHAMLERNFAEGLRRSADGWVDDVMAFSTSWGFDLTAIVGPVLLWHGEDDIFAPAAHSRWLAARIPGSRLEMEPSAQHFGALRVMSRILSWAVA